MKKRMPAEWENPKTVLMAYPALHTDWDYIIDEAKAQFDEIIRTLVKGGEYVWLIADRDSVTPEIRHLIEDNEGLILSDIPYNDTWTRDYGPITTESNDGVNQTLDFGFNGWGLKFAADKDNLVNLRMARRGILAPEKYLNNRDFVLEGGSIETDGRGTLLSTTSCLCSPNRNGGKTKKEVEAILSHRLHIRRFLWLDHGFLEGDDTDSHIDTLARMAPEDTILYVSAPEDRTDVHYSELKLMEEQLKEFLTADGQSYRLIPLPFPDPVFDEVGNRLPATYANYLVTGWNLYMPVYGQPANDLAAQEAIRKAFPEHQIFTVDCRILIKQHGSLHCSTMQLY